MTTIHAYTNDQKILDQIHSDMRRARAAGDVDDPDHHRRRPRGRRGAARTEGQARRLGDPRADARTSAWSTSPSRRSATPASTRSTARSRRRRKAARSKGILDLYRRAAGLDRLQPQSGELDRRQPRNRGARRQARPRRLAGTTMNGASRTAWSTPPGRWRSCSERHPARPIRDGLGESSVRVHRSGFAEASGNDA